MNETELMALLAPGNPPLRPADASIRYGAHPSQYGQLRLPRGSERKPPLAVLVHGGFWRAGWSLVHMDYLATALVEHGFATWNLEYRRIGESGGGYPGTFDDICSGMRQVPELARAHRLDADRVVLVGCSAGGQLALWWASRERTRDERDYPRIRGVIALAPVCDLEQASVLALDDGAADALLGGSPAQHPERYAAFSPQRLLDGSVPQVLIHGTADRHVPFAHTESYCAAGRERGLKIALVRLESADHFTLLTAQPPMRAPLLEAIDALLANSRDGSAGLAHAPREATSAALEHWFATQRKQFPGLSSGVAGALVHLNNGAGSEMPVQAIEAVDQWLRSNFCNEGAGFRRLEASANLVGQAREATADLLGSSAGEIGFGANTTTNLFHIARAIGRTLRSGDRVLVSEACHEANIAPWLTLRDYGAEVALIPMLDDTHLDYAWLEANIDQRTRLVAVGASSNATGTIHDVARVVRAAQRVSALVALDAAHYVPHGPIDFSALGVDLLFFSIYKCFGPHLGAFCVAKSLCEQLPEFGMPHATGTQATAARFETGTRSFALLAGWLGTLTYLGGLGLARLQPSAANPARRQRLRAAMQSISDWEQELTRYADALLRTVPGLALYAQTATDERPRLGIFSFNLAGLSPARVARALDEAGIEATTGHFGALRTMNRLAARHSGAGVRLSIAHYNTKADIDRAVNCLRQLAARSLS